LARQTSTAKIFSKTIAGRALPAAKRENPACSDRRMFVRRPEDTITIEPRSPAGYYVYTITVSDVVRYIGKGKGLRMYAHMKEVRSRLARDFRLGRIGSKLQRNLTRAVLAGETVIEEVLIENLTDKAAYKLEYDHMREYVLAGKRDQLWNVIPGSIYTPQELQAFTDRLRQNLTSRDRLIRYFLGRTLAELTERQSSHSRAPYYLII
jgi:hypothetical protein